MDGEPVEGEPSGTEHSYDPNTGILTGATTFTEIFATAFPQYLFMGMSYDEFWRQDPSLVIAYRQAWKMKVSHRNWEMWMQGGYFYDALLKVAPVMSGGMGKGKTEPGKYPGKPYPLTKKEVREQEEERRRAALQKMLAMFSAESDYNKAKAEQQKQEPTEDNAQTTEVRTNG